MLKVPVPPEKIIELAEKSGFATELRTAAILHASGWKVNQSVYYIDNDEKVGRELDISAYRVAHDDNAKPECYLVVNLCIEVKKTSEPFIFFTSSTSTFEPGGGFSLLHWKKNVDRNILSHKDLSSKRPYSKPERIARSYVSFKDGKTQQIQSGVLSAVKGAIHFRDECDEVYSESSHDFSVFFPILVVDGPIYECYFKAGSAELVSEEVDSVVYMQNYRSQSYGGFSTRVTVIRLDQLADYLSGMNHWSETLLQAMVANRGKFEG